MISLLNLFTTNLLPIILIASIGFFLHRLFRLDPRPLSQIVFYAFSPALVFNLLISTNMATADLFRMVGLAATVIFLIGLISLGISRFTKLDRTTTAAFVLSASFMNSGNYGLSLNQFVLGEAGMAWASIFFITSSMLINSAGVYVAAAGRQSAKKALIGLVRVPAVYVIPLAFLMRTFHWSLPLVAERTVDILSAGAIPCMLILLGMQISNARVAQRRGLLSSVIVLRLIVSPLLAWLLTPLLGLRGISAQAGILEAAMPSAVFTTVIATKFDAEPEFATSAVLATTLLSPLTITPLLAILGG
ncbi:MAG: hypothetical protein GTO14_14850 [Anaerolineales bacterium]|nr:hypothetical protein [Anaerolineales bacterium]